MNIRDFESDGLPGLLSNFDGAYNSVNPNNNINWQRFTYAGTNYRPKYGLTYYTQGEIKYVYLPPDCNGISFGFSGCAMAYFIFNGNAYIAHIYLSGHGDPYDCGDVWNNFISTNKGSIKEYVIFRPNSGNRLLDYMRKHSSECRNSVVGIITSRLHCYSIVTDKNYKPLYMIERKKRKYYSNNLALESNLNRFSIPENRSNW